MRMLTGYAWLLDIIKETLANKQERNNYEQLLIRGMKGKFAALWLSLIDTPEFLRLKP